ncbi:MAG: hypothetical protein WCT25_00030 [Candidatus Paceibacterota bacterium]
MSKNRRKKKRYVPYKPKQMTSMGVSYMPKRVNVLKLNSLPPLVGFATTNTPAGKEELVPILVRAYLTSDEREFHLYMEQVSNIIIERAKKAGIILSIDSFVEFVLVIHKDGTGELHLDGAGRAIEILTKRTVQAGEAVYGGDIGDIRRMKYHALTPDPSDKIVACFKIGWKFGMFFDLSGELDTDRMERDLATLYKRLRYQAMYEALADEATVERMTKAGWFPFIEVIGGDFDPLIKAYKAEFDIEAKEKQLVAKFTSERIDKIAERWWRNPALAKHKTVLQAGLDAFKGNDPVSSIKNIMTEIEGVLADVHLAEKGSTAKTKALLKHAVEKGVKKVDGEASLFFPSNFLEYLLKVAYPDFDPNAPEVAGASRHTVGHGYAAGETYTQARALQVILTLDQIVFYL